MPVALIADPSGANVSSKIAGTQGATFAAGAQTRPETLGQSNFSVPLLAFTDSKSLAQLPQQ